MTFKIDQILKMINTEIDLKQCICCWNIWVLVGTTVVVGILIISILQSQYAPSEAVISLCHWQVFQFGESTECKR